MKKLLSLTGCLLGIALLLTGCGNLFNDSALADLKSKNEELQTQNDELSSKNEELQTQNESLQSKLDTCETDLTGLRSQVESLDLQIASEKADKEALKNKISELESLLEEASASDDTAYYESQLLLLKQDLIAKENNISYLEKNKTQLLSQIQELQAQIRQLENEKLTLQVKLAEYEANAKAYLEIIKDFTSNSSEFVSDIEATQENIDALQSEVNDLRNEELQLYRTDWRSESAFSLNAAYTNFQAKDTPELIADLKNYSKKDPYQYIVGNNMVGTVSGSLIYKADRSKVLMYHDDKFYWGDELNTLGNNDWGTFTAEEICDAVDPAEITEDYALYDYKAQLEKAWGNDYGFDWTFVNKARADITTLEQKEAVINEKNNSIATLNAHVNAQKEALAILETQGVREAYYAYFEDEIERLSELENGTTDSSLKKQFKTTRSYYENLRNNYWGKIEEVGLPVSIAEARELEPEYVVMYPRGSTFYSYGYRKETSESGDVYYYCYKGFHYVGIWQLSCVQKVIKSHDFSALLDHENPNFIGTPLDFTRYVWVSGTGALNSEDFTQSDWSHDSNRAKSGTYNTLSTYITRANDSYIDQAGFYNVFLWSPEGDYPTIFDNVCYNCGWHDCWSTKETQAAGEEAYNNWSINGTAVSNYVYSSVNMLYNTGSPNYNYTLYTQNKAQKWADIKAMLPTGPGDFKETDLPQQFAALGQVSCLESQANFMPDDSRYNYLTSLDWANKTMTIYGSGINYSAEDWNDTLTVPLYQNKCDFAKWEIAFDSSFSPSEGTVILVGHYTDCTGYQYVSSWGSGACRQQVGDYVRVLIHKDAEGNWYVAWGTHSLARKYAPDYYACFTNVWQNITGQGQNTSNGSLDSLVGIVGENLETYLNPAKAPHLAKAIKIDDLATAADAKVAKVSEAFRTVIGATEPTSSVYLNLKGKDDESKTCQVSINLTKSRLTSINPSQISWAPQDFRSNYMGQWCGDQSRPTTFETIEGGWKASSTGYFRDWNGPSDNRERRFYYKCTLTVTNDGEFSFSYTPEDADNPIPADLPDTVVLIKK